MKKQSTLVICADGSETPARKLKHSQKNITSSHKSVLSKINPCYYKKVSSCVNSPKSNSGKLFVKTHILNDAKPTEKFNSPLVEQPDLENLPSPYTRNFQKKTLQEKKNLQIQHQSPKKLAEIQKKDNISIDSFNDLMLIEKEKSKLELREKLPALKSPKKSIYAAKDIILNRPNASKSQAVKNSKLGGVRSDLQKKQTEKILIHDKYDTISSPRDYGKTQMKKSKNLIIMDSEAKIQIQKKGSVKTPGVNTPFQKGPAKIGDMQARYHSRKISLALQSEGSSKNKLPEIKQPISKVKRSTQNLVIPKEVDKLVPIPKPRLSQAEKQQKFFDQIEEYNKSVAAAKDDDSVEAPRKQMFKHTDFQVGLQIGQGAFAVVKRSVHKDSGHTIALKTYDKKSLNNEVATTNLHREIFVLATLKHPNIMTLYEVIDSRTHVHLVMELCRGTNLFHTIKKRKPDQRLPEQEAAQVFKQIVSAVAYMHDYNVVHRDLKLDNILTNVDADGNHTIKLIDFGFATGCTADEKLNNSCGTPHYMDPDLVRKQSYNAQAADVWALGVILFILTTGKLPFYGAFEADLYRKIQAGRYQYPNDMIEKDGSTYTPSCSLKALIRKILEPNACMRLTCEQILKEPWLTENLKGLNTTQDKDKSSTNESD